MNFHVKSSPGDEVNPAGQTGNSSQNRKWQLRFRNRPKHPNQNRSRRIFCSFTFERSSRGSITTNGFSFPSAGEQFQGQEFVPRQQTTRRLSSAAHQKRTRTLHLSRYSLTFVFRGRNQIFLIAFGKLECEIGEDSKERREEGKEDSGAFPPSLSHRCTRTSYGLFCACGRILSRCRPKPNFTPAFYNPIKQPF